MLSVAGSSKGTPCPVHRNTAVIRAYQQEITRCGAHSEMHVAAAVRSTSRFHTVEVHDGRKVEEGVVVISAMPGKAKRFMFWSSVWSSHRSINVFVPAGPSTASPHTASESVGGTSQVDDAGLGAVVSTTER